MTTAPDSKWFSLFFAYVPAIQAVNSVLAAGFATEEKLTAALQSAADEFLTANPECRISQWELAAEFLEMMK